MNGPDTPPVLYDGGSAAGGFRAATSSSTHDYNEEPERCRQCYSSALITDWPQGDRVCTDCGVVAEEGLLDERPEWKDFNDADDLVRGLPSKARSGLVPVNEARYVGGLQPTTLSKHAYGPNVGGYKLARIRRQLKTTNKRLNHLMEKRHKKELEDARLERKIRLKKNDGVNEGMERAAFAPGDFERMILQEEDDVVRMQTALYADKWSLDRALILYGPTNDSTEPLTKGEDGEDRESLSNRLDGTLKKASSDMYTAYSLLLRAAQQLELPDRVVNEVVHRLVRYATRRDGFTVKGVSSRLSAEASRKTTDKNAGIRIKEYNKVKQMSSLSAAFLFLTSRSMGWTRTVAEICECFQPPPDTTREKSFLKPKHCSRAILEIKATFPEYTRLPPAHGPSTLQSHKRTNEITSPPPADRLSTFQFADHFVRRLKLPPVAEASVRELLVHCRHEQVELGHNSGTKLPTLCAAVAFFICSVGSAMHRVAQQQVNTQQRCNEMQSSVLERSANKRNSPGKETSNVGLQHAPKKQRISDIGEDDGDGNDDTLEKSPFDVFTHGAIEEDKFQNLEYEMRRMWDAWAEQMPWSRSSVEIEQACGISERAFRKVYKCSLYPRRDTLLTVLKDGASKDSLDLGSSSLRETPMAWILLSHVAMAGDLLKEK